MYPRSVGLRANTAASASPTVPPGTSADGQSTNRRRLAVKVTRGMAASYAAQGRVVDPFIGYNPISDEDPGPARRKQPTPSPPCDPAGGAAAGRGDRKSTRLNSSH